MKLKFIIVIHTKAQQFSNSMAITTFDHSPKEKDATDFSTILERMFSRQKVVQIRFICHKGNVNA